jgi:putative FmdB family regulatory protein
LPTYEYRCVSCEYQFERFQRMSDEPVKECEVCGEPVKRLLFPVAIQFKGSGFYTTDYARKSTLGHSGSSTANGASEASHARADSEGGNGNGHSEKSGEASFAASEPSKPASPAPVTKIA